MLSSPRTARPTLNGGEPEVEREIEGREESKANY